MKGDKKNCLVCQTEFIPKNPKGKFCSAKCRMKNMRAKETEVIVTEPPLKSIEGLKSLNVLKKNAGILIPKGDGKFNPTINWVYDKPEYGQIVNQTPILTQDEVGALGGSLRAGPPVKVTLKPPADPNVLQDEINEIVAQPINQEQLRGAFIKLANGETPQPVKLMPKGLTLAQQLDWRLENIVKIK